MDIVTTQTEMDDDEVNIGALNECNGINCDGHQHSKPNETSESHHNDAAFSYHVTTQDITDEQQGSKVVYPRSSDPAIEHLARHVQATPNTTKLSRQNRSKKKKDQEGWIKSEEMQGHKEDEAKSVEATLAFINGEPVPTDTTDNHKRNRKSKSSKTIRKTDNQTLSSAATVSMSNGSDDDDEEEDEKKLGEANELLEQSEETLQTIKSLTSASIKTINGSNRANSAGLLQHSSSDDMDFIEDAEFKEVNRKKKSKEHRLDKQKVVSNSNNYNKNTEQRQKTANTSVTNKPSHGSGNSNPSRVNDSKTANFSSSSINTTVAAPSFDLNSFPALESNVRTGRRTSLGDIKSSLESASATDDERDSVKSQPQVSSSCDVKPIQSWANVAANPTNTKKQSVVSSNRPETDKKLQTEPQNLATSETDLNTYTYTESFGNVPTSEIPANTRPLVMCTEPEPPPYQSLEVTSSTSAIVSNTTVVVSSTQQSNKSVTNRPNTSDRTPSSSTKASQQATLLRTDYTRTPSIEFGTVTTGDDVNTNEKVKDILSHTANPQITQSQAKQMPKSRNSSSAYSMLKNSSKSKQVPRNNKPVIFLDKDGNREYQSDIKITFGYGNEEASSSLNSLSCAEMTQSYPGSLTQTANSPGEDAMVRSMIEPSSFMNTLPESSSQKMNKSRRVVRTNSRDGHRVKGRYFSYHKGFDHSSIASMLMGEWCAVQRLMSRGDRNILYVRVN